MALLLALACSGGAQPAKAYGIRWWVIGGGGGRSSNDSYTLVGSLGQPATGPAIGGSFRLSGGLLPVDPVPIFRDAFEHLGTASWIVSP